jgi:hypothetical protein
MHPNLAIIAQNRLGASPKNGISLEGIIIFLKKISAKTPNPELLRSIPGNDGSRRKISNIAVTKNVVPRMILCKEDLAWTNSVVCVTVQIPSPLKDRKFST